jgi:broad specificity phosphatase PhoE
MEIILARHGKPNFKLWSWITPRQMKDWIKFYNQADILIENVPLETLKKATESGVIVSSTLSRCVQSAQQLIRDRALLTEEIFCEADLPHMLWRFPKLPLSVWGIVFRLAWFCGFSANAEPLVRATTRARNAAERLVELSRENGSVFHVGHGIMTMLIAKQLLASGWTGPKRPVNKYWQYSVYRAPA